MLNLALPVVLTHLAIMFMGVVDLLFVGKLGASAIGAVGLGTSISGWFMMFGVGVLTGLDYLISFAWGAIKPDDCHRAWVQGILLSLGLGILLTAALLVLSAYLSALGVNPAILGKC